jgi:hypothetical protein
MFYGSDDSTVLDCRRNMQRSLAHLVMMIGVLAAASAPMSAQAHEKGDEAKPPPEVRMQIIAPSAKGPWLLRIDNEGDRAVRIAADVRLLTLSVRAPAKKKVPVRRTYGWGWQRRVAKCDGPKQFGLTKHFPAQRELVLDPGHSYVEEFDPRLICFGKNAEVLRPGAKVKATLGWKPKPKWSRRMAAAPFVVDDAERPRKNRPLRRLEAATLLLSHGEAVEYGVAPLGTPEEADDEDLTPSEKRAAGIRRGKGKKRRRGKKKRKKKPASAEEASRYRVVPTPKKQPPPPTTDELSAALTLTASEYDDAWRPTGVQLSVQAHNTGQRPIFIALRSRMLSFVVHGPDGLVKCRRKTSHHEVPRDLFRTLQHGKHVHMSVLLGELCPPRTFDRPGLYVAAPILHADANGAEYGLSAITGTVTSREPGKVGGTHKVTDDMTLIRIRHGRKRYHKEPPIQIPTRILED